MRRWDRINLALAFLLAALLLANWQLTGNPGGTALLALNCGQPGSIRVIRNNQLQLAFTQHADGWKLSHPSTAEVKQQRVETLAAICNARGQQGFAVAGHKLNTFGLLPPVLTLQLNEQVLQFGNIEPISGNRYVRIGQQILLVDDLWYRIASLPLKHYLADKGE